MTRKIRRWPALLLLVVPVVPGLCACSGKPNAGSSPRSLSASADADGDGVADLYDQCPGQGLPGRVNAVGCPDQDMDGVADASDTCPETPRGAPVDVRGCPRQLPPIPAWSGESYQPRIISAARRRDLLLAGLAVAPDMNCKTDNLPPPTPVVTRPSIWSVEFARPWTPGESVTITWGSVADVCPPVTYGLEVQRRTEAAAIWQPYLQLKNLSTPSYTVPWSEMGYLGRYRVYARDNSGNRSGDSAWRYFRFCGPDVPPADHLVPLPGGLKEG